MPQYDFQCQKCKRILENQFLRITHLPDELPECCDETMNYHITQPPLVHWKDPVIEPFRNPSAKRGSPDSIIHNTKQRREFMAKNDLVDGNDVVGKAPTHIDDEAFAAEMQKSIDAITPSAEESAIMESQGLMDPSHQPE
jgi:hypothetical protein